VCWVGIIADQLCRDGINRAYRRDVVVRNGVTDIVSLAPHGDLVRAARIIDLALIDRAPEDISSFLRSEQRRKISGTESGSWYRKGAIQRGGQAEMLIQPKD